MIPESALTSEHYFSRTTLDWEKTAFSDSLLVSALQQYTRISEFSRTFVEFLLTEVLFSPPRASKNVTENKTLLPPLYSATSDKEKRPQSWQKARL
jgi:hypothetical protein